MSNTTKKQNGSFPFLEWKVYQDSKVLFSEIVEITHAVAPKYKNSITDQIIRSSLSVVNNIAEGNGRSATKDAPKELNHFLNIAQGSLYETLALLDVMKDIGLITPPEFAKLGGQIGEIGRQIGGFRKNLRKSSVSY